LGLENKNLTFKHSYSRKITILGQVLTGFENFQPRTALQWGMLISHSLPTHVITAVSVDSFKNRLDKFWANDEARFDYNANLSGSGFARCF